MQKQKGHHACGISTSVKFERASPANVNLYVPLRVADISWDYQVIPVTGLSLTHYVAIATMEPDRVPRDKERLTSE